MSGKKKVISEGDASVQPSEIAKDIKDVALQQRLKHPLANAWSVWLYSNISRKWEQNQIEITSFETVEDFWCLYHHMKLPTELNHGQDYSIFKRGVQPMWEDSSNRKGGRWLITFDKRNIQEMDRIWLDTVLLMIGENYDNLNSLICGAVVNYRPKNNRNKIGVWLADKDNEKENMCIGKKLKKLAKISSTINFFAHDSNNALYNL